MLARGARAAVSRLARRAVPAPRPPPRAMASAEAAAYAPGSLLAAEPDRYGGMVVDEACVASLAPDDFSARLAASVGAWRAQGVKGVWLKVPHASASLVPAAAALGFHFHHA